MSGKTKEQNKKKQTVKKPYFLAQKSFLKNVNFGS